MKKIAVIGLGYVGLPLARLFATKYPTVGFDINQKRIDELRAGHDSTLEVEDDILQAVLVNENPFSVILSDSEGSQKHENTKAQKDKNTKEQSIDPATRNPQPGLYCSNQLSDIAVADFYVVTVPTPVDKHNRPDLTPLYKASETVGKVLKKGDIVVYESTVYPGVTEEECIPVLERVSGLKFNVDFFAGYSPERINPGD